MRCDPDEPDTDVGSIEMKLVPALVTDYTCTYPWMIRYRTVQGLFVRPINLSSSFPHALPAHTRAAITPFEEGRDGEHP
jgi:hypothetical protein